MQDTQDQVIFLQLLHLHNHHLLNSSRQQSCSRHPSVMGRPSDASPGETWSGTARCSCGTLSGCGCCGHGSCGPGCCACHACPRSDSCCGCETACGCSGIGWSEPSRSTWSETGTWSGSEIETWNGTCCGCDFGSCCGSESSST